MSAYVPYAPLNTLKPFADEVWIVDGPEVGMSYLGLTLPFPTRMTIVRLGEGELWAHSPIAWSEALAADLATLGEVRHLVAPNTLHHSYLQAWRAHYPDARSYGPPGLSPRTASRLKIEETLGGEPPERWRGAFEQCVVPGRVLTEVVFFHCRSRTLILTDLIENFEPARVRDPWLRGIIRLSGAADPDGKAPLDMQWSFRGSRPAVRAAVTQMMSWTPERIVLAHGRCYGSNGEAELRRAFRWAL